MKTEDYYEEAESMHKGWSEYLKIIDGLKDNVNNKEEITLKEACYILHGDMYPSFIWEKFKEYCEGIGLEHKRMIWECWKGLFELWQKEKN
jgi:hypothetical protein